MDGAIEEFLATLEGVTKTLLETDNAIGITAEVFQTADLGGANRERRAWVRSARELQQAVRRLVGDQERLSARVEHMMERSRFRA